MRLSSIACFGLPSLGYYCPVGRNSERRSMGFGASDTILRVKKHELTICNAAHGYTICYIKIGIVEVFVKQATATRAPVVWIIHPFHALNVIFTYWMHFLLAGIGSEL